MAQFLDINVQFCDTQTQFCLCALTRQSYCVPVLHPLCSIQSHPITNKRFPKKIQLYIIGKLHAEAHLQMTYSQFQYLLGKHNSKVHRVPWNKPRKLCVLCNKFFSLFMLNAEYEYLLNTHVVFYSFILPYICQTCTPQFVYQKVEIFSITQAYFPNFMYTH